MLWDPGKGLERVSFIGRLSLFLEDPLSEVAFTVVQLVYEYCEYNAELHLDHIHMHSKGS